MDELHAQLMDLAARTRRDVDQNFPYAHAVNATVINGKHVKVCATRHINPNRADHVAVHWYINGKHCRKADLEARIEA